MWLKSFALAGYASFQISFMPHEWKLFTSCSHIRLCQVFSDWPVSDDFSIFDLVPGTSQPLKRLIVDSTGRFLKRDGGWTTNEADAMDFEDIAALLRSCARYQVRDAEVLLRFSSTRKFDVRFPLPH